MDVVLSDVDIEVVETVLVQSRLLTSRSHITRHCIRNYSAANGQMLPDYLDQGRVLPVGDVVKEGNACGSAKHAEDSIDLSGKHCALRQLLSAKSSFIDFHRPWQLDIRQHLCLHKKTASLPYELEVLNDLVPVSDYVLSQSGPHIVDPQVDRDVKQFDIQVAKRGIHGNAFANATSTALPDQLGS